MTPDEMNEFRGEAAALIREHLWLGKTPPRSPDARPWHMGRELSIWNLLVAANHRPSDINGAITVVRKIRKDWDGQPVKMTCFYWTRQGGVFTATPFLEMCIGHHLSLAKRGMSKRLDVPPTVGAVLRRAIG